MKILIRFSIFVVLLLNISIAMSETTIKWECTVSGYGVTSSRIPHNCAPEETSAYSEAPKAQPPAEEDREARTLVFDTPQDLTSIQGSGKNGAIVYFGDGDDTLNIKKADDVIYAGGGNDNISTGTWYDVIDAGDGDDSIDGGWGLDILYGGAGSDSINGGERGDNWQQTDTLVYTKPRDAYDIMLDGSDTSMGDALRITDRYS